MDRKNFKIYLFIINFLINILCYFISNQLKIKLTKFFYHSKKKLKIKIQCSLLVLYEVIIKNIE